LVEEDEETGEDVEREDRPEVEWLSYVPVKLKDGGWNLTGVNDDVEDEGANGLLDLR